MISIELCKATGRNTPCYWVTVAGAEILFSYQTPIAVRGPRGSARLHNRWGPTTGRHMNDAGVRDWPEIEHEAMDKMISDSIIAGIVQPVVRVLEGRRA